MQFRFPAAIFDLELGGRVFKIGNTTTKTFDPEDMGEDARITFLSALEREIPMGVGPNLW